MRIECGGNELTVTSTHLADDGDVVVHVRLPDKVMERLRQPAQPEWFFDQPNAENFKLGTIINVSGRLHRCVVNVAGDNVWVPVTGAPDDPNRGAYETASVDALSAKAANACLPKPGPNDGILDEVRRIRDEVRRRHTCIEDVHSDVVKLCNGAEAFVEQARGCAREAHGFEKSARSNNIAAQEARDGALDAAKLALGRKILPDKADPTDLITREQALREFHAAAEERDKLRGQYNAAMDELKNEQTRHAETVERLRAATAEPEPAFDADGRQTADTLSREQLKVRWHAAADERDEARQKYTACKAELLREQGRHNQTSERMRRVQAERDEWLKRAEDTGDNLRSVTAERDNWMETAKKYCKDVKYWQDKAGAGSDDVTVRQLTAERDEALRRAETAEAACKHAEINPETGEKWGTGAPLINPTD